MAGARHRDRQRRAHRSDRPVSGSNRGHRGRLRTGAAGGGSGAPGAQPLVISPPGKHADRAAGERRPSVFGDGGGGRHTPIPEARVLWEVADTSSRLRRCKGALTGKVPGRTTLTSDIHGFDPVIWTIEIIPGTSGWIAPGLDWRWEPGHPACRPARRRWEGDRTSARARLGQQSPRHRAGFRRRGARGRQARRAIVTATGPWGKADSADVLVMGDLIIASNRGGAFEIYQFRWADPTRYSAGAERQRSFGAARVFARSHPIAFSSERAGAGYDLFLVDADGRNLEAAHQQPRQRRRACLVARGAGIVFTWTPKRVRRSFSHQADGSGLRQLTSAHRREPLGRPSRPTVALGVHLPPGRQAGGLRHGARWRGGAAADQDRRQGIPAAFLPDGDAGLRREHSKGSRVMRPYGGRERSSSRPNSRLRRSMSPATAGESPTSSGRWLTCPRQGPFRAVPAASDLRLRAGRGAPPCRRADPDPSF